MALKKKVKKAAGRKKPAKKTVKKSLKKRAVKKKTIKKRPAQKKKTSLKKKSPATKKQPGQKGRLIGLITHYFPHVQAAVIKLKEPLSMGDTVKIKGHTTDLTQAVTSMQIDRTSIAKAKKSDEIGLQVSSRVRQGDEVYRL
ncbi:MAG: hypothetical protein PHW98_06115 [Candidatus Omnitrophica bacterium]|nr:hypothetical protein [Candidatus Omnitrophota bacterium]MDD5506278.1 hypothetical protein [Candidatus Omnitrophota bacterium]